MTRGVADRAGRRPWFLPLRQEGPDPSPTSAPGRGVQASLYVRMPSLDLARMPRPDDECPYPKPFPADFDACPAFQARQFIPLATLYQPLEPVLTCRHLETRSMTQRYRWYGACALGNSDARPRWPRQVGGARLERIRAVQRELGAAIAPYTTRLWELKGQQLRATRDGSDGGPATIELQRLS